MRRKGRPGEARTSWVDRPGAAIIKRYSISWEAAVADPGAVEGGGSRPARIQQDVDAFREGLAVLGPDLPGDLGAVLRPARGIHLGRQGACEAEGGEKSCRGFQLPDVYHSVSKREAHILQPPGQPEQGHGLPWREASSRSRLSGSGSLPQDIVQEIRGAPRSRLPFVVKS